MRFGHIRLHPNDSSWSEEKIRSILDKKIIGMDDDNYSAPSFKQCAEGDVIVVVHQAKAVALVRVLGSASAHTPNPDLDWFNLSCEVEVLEYASDVFTEDERSFPMNRSFGAFMWAKSKNDIRDFIENWYKNYFLRNVMSEIILEEKQKQKLQNLFENYKPNWNEGSLESTLSEWKVYYEKINSPEGLALNEYTNIMTFISDNADVLPGGYLCNFLEKKSKAFGYSRPGGSQQYMVHLNAPEDKKKTKNSKKKDGPKDPLDKVVEKTYYIKDKIENKTTENASEEVAKSFYESNIKELLKDLSNVSTLDRALEIESSNLYKNYEAKQILQKIVILSTVEKDLDFIGIYDKKTIDDLFAYFFGIKDISASFYSKNNAIAIAVKSILSHNSGEFDLEYWRKISSFLWDLANSENLGSEESPNVIFYGAPGTGKTYTVLNTVKFITRNESTFYEKLQFHPSFTYEDFIDGLKPVGVTESGNMKFEFINGSFKEFCIKAKSHPTETYYFIVDEVNRANLSAVFGETLSLLETDYRYTEKNKNLIKTQNCQILESLIKDAKREVELASDLATKEEKKAIFNSLVKKAFDYDEKTGSVTFGIPANIRFVGMMNDVDKSIDTFDLALRRRFKWVPMSCNYDVIEDFYSKYDENEESKITEYVNFCKKLNKYITNEKNGLGLGSSYEFGHSFFMKLQDKKVTKGNRVNLFNNYLKPTLKEYLRGFFEESEIDDKLKETAKIFGVVDEKNSETSDEDNDPN